jgi:hypothetical protein
MSRTDAFAPARRPWWHLAIAVGIGALVAFTFRGCTRAAPPTATRSAGSSGAGPTGNVAGVPVGFAHSRDGARAAAANYVTTGQAMLDADPLGAGDAVRAMAATSTADAQANEMVRRLAALRVKLATGTGPVRYWQAVLATRVESYQRTRARVVVWSVGVLSRRDVAAPQAGWSTSTFDLVWERGDWKVTSERISSGPTPMLNLGAHPSTPDHFQVALRGFDAWATGGGA